MEVGERGEALQHHLLGQREIVAAEAADVVGGAAAHCVQGTGASVQPPRPLAAAAVNAILAVPCCFSGAGRHNFCSERTRPAAGAADRSGEAWTAGGPGGLRRRRRRRIRIAPAVHVWRFAGRE